MKRLSVMVAVLFLSLAWSCDSGGPGKGGSDPGTSGKDDPAPAKTYVVGFSQSDFENPWRIHMNEQMKEAAARHPEIELIVANGENSDAKQIADVENFLARGVDALIVSPREAAPLTEVVAKAYDGGIPVIVLDRKIPGDKYTTFIGANNEKIGEEAALLILRMLEGRGNIVEIRGIPGATATTERHEGFVEVIKKEPGLRIIYDQPGGYERSPARDIMDNALRAYKDIDAVYAHDDEMAIGAYLAAKAAGREKDIFFVGIGGRGEAVEMIRDGELGATFVYPNGAEEAVAMVMRIFSGQPVPKEIRLNTMRITRYENEEYTGF